MSEVYGAEVDLFRVHEEPYTGRAKYGAKSSRVRMTGMSFASLKENIRQKKIAKKAAKYNEEYRALFDLAIGVDEARQEYGEGKSDYSVVKENIELYNRQARRLAEIGVQVLMLTSDIQKISFEKETSAKALKVPGFLIGPLKMLTKAGREKAKLENEARLEKEKAIADAIVATAEEAVGQLKTDEVNEDKLDSLKFGNVTETVVDKLTEPTVDEEAKKKAAQEEEERKAREAAEAEEKAREAAAAKEKEEIEAKERLAKLKASGDEALKRNYGKGKKPGHEGAKKATEAVEREDAFDVLKSVNDVYDIALLKCDEELEEFLGIKIEGKTELLLPPQYGEMLKKATGEDISKEVYTNSYRNTLAVVKLAKVWEKVATREIALEDGTKEVGAYDEENRTVFNFVMDAVVNGLSAEEMKAKAEAELSEEDAKVVTAAAEEYDVIVVGMQVVKANLTEEKVETSDLEEETVVEDKAEMYKVGNAKLAEIGLSLYSKKVEVEEEEEVIAPVVTETKDEEEAVVATDTEEKVEPVVDEKPKMSLGFVDQIGSLVAEIEALTAHRDRLKGLLGDEANEALESLNNSINERLAKINALASGSIVSLGKDGDKKEATVVETKEEDVVEEDLTDEEEVVVTPAEKDEKKVISTSEEMKVEEKAEIDARVVTGAHVHVDAKPENFSPDNRYAAAKRDPYIRLISGKYEPEEEAKVANHGILTDAEKEEAIEWWTRMGAVLDSPESQKLSEIRLEELRKKEEREALERQVADQEFAVKKQRRIDEEHERMREQTARLQLAHCKPLEEYDIDEFIAANGQNVAEEDRFTTPSGLVSYMEKRAPKMYEEMMTSYNESMAEKQARMIENGHEFSEESVEKFSKK